MEIPFIAMTQKPGIPEIGEYVFRNFLTSDRHVETLVDYAMGRLGMRRFAVLYPDEAYGKPFRDLFARELDKRGGVLAGTGVYRPGKTDFSESIIKMGAISTENEEDRRFSAGVDFDAVFIPDSPRVAGLIIPQLRYYDITDTPMLGTNLWHSQQLIQIAGRELGEVLIPEGVFPQKCEKGG